jgi:hypothetical protein
MSPDRKTPRRTDETRQFRSAIAIRLEWRPGKVLQFMAFIAPWLGFFHYAIAIALSTSDDMLNFLCASALQPQQ